MCAVFVHSVLHSLHGGVDVLSLRLEEAQHLFALRNLRRESHQRLQRERATVSASLKTLHSFILRLYLSLKISLSLNQNCLLY